MQQQDDILSELRDIGRISNEEHKKIKLEVISEKAENAKYVFILLHPPNWEKRHMSRMRYIICSSAMRVSARSTSREYRICTS